MIHEIQSNWNAVFPFVSIIKSEDEYLNRINILEEIFEIVDEDDIEHPLRLLSSIVSDTIHDYESINYPFSRKDFLVALMKKYKLRQSDLPEIGSQGVVSEIISGKRKLNKRQVQALSQRFGVSPKILFD
jgi:HTH-type transcriptional regulator/antitoxin HigA